jgi:hypothetical protein
MIPSTSVPDSTRSKRGRTASPDNGDRAALTIPHDPSGNGVLNSDSWQKIRKTAANLAQLAQMLLTLLLRFNWRILPNQANGSARPTPADNWQIPINEETWRRLQKLRLRGESISECIIRVIIITQLKRGLL